MPDDKKKKKLTRKDFLKQELVKHLEERYPKTNKHFYLYEIIEPSGGSTKGSFRDYLRKKGDNLTPQDRYIIRDIFQELKKEKVLFHKASDVWVRL